jgi:glycosyltransferase involved in cell wall biosynthesis
MSTATPLFSIVIPTFNRAKLIESAINSVLAQTFTDWELIIVDDGSTDKTKEVVVPYLKDSRIRYHFQENKELNGARNTGIRLAQGKYLCFLDDDDFYLENHLAVLADFIEKNNFPTAFIRIGVYLQRGQNRTKLPNMTSSATNPVEFIWENPVNLLSLAIHADILKAFTFPEEFLNFDEVHLLLRAVLDFPFYQIDEYTAVYIHHPQARTQNYWDESKANNHFQAMDDLFKQSDGRLEQFISPKMKQRAYSSQHLTFANAAISSKNFNIAAQYIYSAFKQGSFWSIWRNYAYTIALYFSKKWFDYPKN